MQVPPFSLDKQLSQIGSDLDEAVSKVLHSGKYIGGDDVERFQKSFAEVLKVPFVVGCNSGTDALVLALRALDVGPGDEVITASFSFFATAEAISNVGAVPVFVDVSSRDFLVNTSLLEEAITPATKVILPVHLFGCPVNMDIVLSIANKYGLRVIEDCAQAAGTFWKGLPVGGFGDVGCFSFFPTKNLGAAGDAGAISTHDALIAQTIKELAVHGMPERYLHTELGYNSRLDALQAAILNIKLPHLSNWINKRSEIAKRYQENLKDLPGLEIPSEPSEEGTIHSWNQFVVQVKELDIQKKILNLKNPIIAKKTSYDLDGIIPRDWLKESLFMKGINTIIYYPIPIHLQPVYKKIGCKKSNLSVTERLSSEVLSLPIFPELTIEQQEYVINTIRAILLD
ncbi:MULTISPECIES: DegT/DnrJ/EryC1/StrS family aminotransferase [Prochlorococcus]|uniref:DegT/DnrJ/EryC1/StrS family aminotransferase n=1 Tax=Prochlorococcus TaxID=1218 RepID=UPI0005338A08|nr:MULTISPECIES: DegT/DnrJ/EryC1/StrS family aminotransferase [Prochlorococcus]KGG13080.1 putative pleiotropic regulatory protein [Prochlorococcus sp. MIT 0601]